MPVTIGTAGHIDHGKTSLVRALTGKNTDRLQAEQERGISIELGYAPLPLSDQTTASLIDVPGHERFVRTMVAGATGIDGFLLVVDAREGPRPQTHEHVAILRLLGVERGVVAVTKADVVDADALASALAAARDLVPGAAVVPVSAKTGSGLDELRGALGDLVKLVARSDRDAPTRLYVDRTFTLHGIGTVVTGTLWSGTIARGDRLLVEPAGVAARVRSVQVHDRDVERADAGQRVAVNVTGVDRARISRGSAVVAPGAFTRSYRLDVELEPLLEIPRAVTLHHGTSQIPARVHRREDRRAQLRLAAPVVAARGDRFVLRTETTVGGGVVLEPAPPRAAAAVPAPSRAPAPTRSAPVSVDVVTAAEAETTLELAGFEPVALDRAVADHLERAGRAVRVGDRLSIGRAAYDHARSVVVGECARAGSITLARFRDLLGTSRRPAQLLLERLDSDGVTRRDGDARVLRRAARPSART